MGQPRLRQRAGPVDDIPYICTVNERDMDKPIYYQPNFLDGSYIDELAPFMVFRTEDDCKFWLEDNGYDLNDIAIWQYEEGEIKDMVVITRDGYYEDGTCSVGAYNLEKDLEEGLDVVRVNLKTVQKLLHTDRIPLNRPITLYEDYGTLSFDDVPYEFSRECPDIVAVDSNYIIDSDSNEIPLENITDWDDFMMVANALTDVYNANRR